MFNFQCSTTSMELEEHLKLKHYQEIWLQALLDETNFELQQLSGISGVIDEQDEFCHIPQGSMLDFLDSMSTEVFESQRERKTQEEFQARCQKLIYHRAWLQDLLQRIRRDLICAKIILKVILDSGNIDKKNSSKYIW